MRKGEITIDINERALKEVRDAADELVAGDSQRTIRFAEAVLAATPDKALVPELALQLEAIGVATPRGDAYTADALLDARQLAENWKGQWHPEAAARTHQEAGTPDSEAGRVLAALCAVGRGEARERPAGAVEGGWELACENVLTNAARGRRWMVSANALRLAMGRKPNVPGRKREAKEALDGLPVHDQTEAISAALAANPNLALALVSSPEAMAAITRAEMHKARDRGDIEGHRPKPLTGPAWVASRLTAARRDIGEAVDAVLDIGGYAAGVPEIVAVALAQLHRAVDAIDGAVAGSARVTDEELAELFG